MEPVKLLEHNLETYENINEMWKKYKRVAVVQATGTGKSFVMLRCIYDFKDEKVLVIAPSHYIIDQIKSNETSIILKNTEFMTYSKLSQLTTDEMCELNPKLIVLDEFHRIGAKKWGEYVRKLLETFPNSKVLGTSATPIRYLDNMRDMSEEIFENNIAVNLSLTDAIVRGIVKMPIYISALFTFDEEITKLRSKVNNSNLNDEEKESIYKKINLLKNNLDKSNGIPSILNKYLKPQSYKFIVFCKNKKHLEMMKELVPKWFIDSGTSNDIGVYDIYCGKTNNKHVLTLFEDTIDNTKIKLLFTIDMLNEGLHVKDVSGVILLRPTCSTITFFQQIGRCISSSTNEHPYIFDFVNNFDNIGASSFKFEMENSFNSLKNTTDPYDSILPFEFTIFDELKDIKELINSINSSISTYKSWDEHFNELNEYYYKNGHHCVDVKENEILSKWIYNQIKNYKRGGLSKYKIELLKSINFSFERSTENWMRKFIEIKKLYENDFNNKRHISSWELKQKALYHDNLLSNEKIKMLESIDFNFNYVYDDVWDYKFNKLKNFYINNGHCDVTSSDDIELNKWVQSLRTRYKKGKLSEEKIIALASINFVHLHHDRLWMENFNKLKEIYTTHNRYITKNEDRLLYYWIVRQRKYHKKQKLSNDKIDLLNSINFFENK